MIRQRLLISKKLSPKQEAVYWGNAGAGVLPLHEAAKSPIDLPDGYAVRIEKDGYYINVLYTYKGKDARTQDADIQGNIQLDEPGWDYDGGWDCLGALEIRGSEAAKGWGPLLYDVAIEYATKKAGGLVADRESVSDSALRVWDYYLNRRSDVKHKQLDDTENTLTPSKKDNCNQGSASELGKDRGIPWHDKKNPLSKIYTKRPAKTMAQLKKLGKLILKV
jgi:hypothetical protein